VWETHRYIPMLSLNVDFLRYFEVITELHETDRPAKQLVRVDGRIEFAITRQHLMIEWQGKREEESLSFAMPHGVSQSVKQSQ